MNKWVQQQDLGKLKDVPADFAGWVQEQGDKLQKGGVVSCLLVGVKLQVSS